MGIPKDSDFEGQWDLITGLPHDMGEIDSSLGAHKQNLAYTKTQGKGAVTPQETNQNYLLSVGGPPVEAWFRKVSPQGQGHWRQQARKVPLGVNPLGLLH